MTKDNAAQYLPLVKALSEGKAIQILNICDVWEDILCPTFDCKPENYRIKPQITTFDVGDVFYSKTDNCKVLIISTFDLEKPIYYLAGFDGLVTFSDTNEEGFTFEQMLDFLNENGYTFVRNINDEITKLINL